MYRVLLVDDEALIREAISENTKWNELGYELVGACKNGREAMEMIEKDPPDLLLTDIYMPYVDGMELTEYVYKNHRETKVVIISGYDEFEYAKKAVKFHVMEYILKPITARELSETLLKIKDVLDEEQRKSQNMKKIRSAYRSNLPVVRGRFLNSLLQGNVAKELIGERLEDYQIQIPGSRLMTAVIMADDLSLFLKQGEKNKSDLAYFAIFNIAEEIVGNHGCGLAFQDVEEKTILLFYGEEGLEKQAVEICEEIRTSIFQFLKIECTIALGGSVGRIEEIHQAYLDTKRVMEYKFLLGGNQVIYGENMHETKERNALDAGEWAKKIALAMKAGSQREVKKEVETMVRTMQEAYITKNRSIFYIQNIILSIINALDATALDEEELLERERELLNAIYQKENLWEIGEDLIAFCSQITESMRDEKDSYCKKQAILALEYIEKNYGDSSISLNTVCAHLAMSTSYFSSIFKSYTGETFIEALTKKRIEKAKRLIENTSKKTYEIADEVGYSDPHYFSSSFKKTTGMTPTEYAKRVR